MSIIRALAAAAAAVVLVYASSPVSAGPCDDDNAACSPRAEQQSAPMKLDQFMQTWKPASVSKRVKRSRSAQRQRNVKQAAKPVAPKAAPVSEAAITAAEQPASPPREEAVAAPAPRQVNEVVTSGSSGQANEVVPAPEHVQVVAFDEVNEIDLAAPAPVETTGQAVSVGQTPADNSWIGKLLLAAAGTIVLAGATRLLLA